MHRLPPLGALEAFVGTVRFGSAREAANALNISPSALSRRISALEEFTGKTLFDRKHHGMQLTSEGTRFYNAVQPHLEALGRAVAAESDNAKLLRLHLGVLPLFGAQRLFPRLRELRAEHPRLHIDIDTGPNLLDRVGSTLDAAIVLSKKPDPALLSHRLDQNLVYAICDQETRKRLGVEPSAEALTAETFLVHQELPESFTSWKKAMGMENLEPAAVDHFDSGQLVLEAAAQGLGIAIMHDDHFRRAHDPRLALLNEREVKSPYSYWFVCTPDAVEKRPVRLFRDWLIKAQL